MIAPLEFHARVCEQLLRYAVRQGALALAINSSEVPRRVPTLGERSVFCTSNLLPVNYWEANTKKTLLFLETFLVRNH